MSMSHAAQALAGLTDEYIAGQEYLTVEDIVAYVDAAADKYSALDRVIDSSNDAYSVTSDTLNKVVAHYRGFGIAGKFQREFAVAEIIEAWEEGQIAHWGEFVKKSRKTAHRRAPKSGTKSTTAKRVTRKRYQSRSSSFHGNTKCPCCGSRQDKGTVCDKCGAAV